MFGFGSPVTCPHCNQVFYGLPWQAPSTDREVSVQDGVAFLIAHAHARNWQSLWEKLTTRFTITYKENT